jgi:hypothetical protein
MRERSNKPKRQDKKAKTVRKKQQKLRVRNSKPRGRYERKLKKTTKRK